MSQSKPIEVPHTLLRTLHRIQEQRTDLNGAIGRVPRQIKAAEALVTTAKAAVDAAKEELKKARLNADEKQLQLQSREAHVEQLQAKLNTAGSNKEFNLLKDQIAADVQANSVQSDEILETWEQIDVLGEKLSAAEAELDQQEKQCSQRVAEIHEKQERLNENLAKVNEQLATAEAELPASVKSDYLRLTASRGDEALAPLATDSCGGCYQTLTTQTINRLQLSQLTHCPNCNAILYMPEDLRVR
ncbi:zinc ribbon domain-containing protein [Crateriforma spongiae]|uniref:zinc ribbon domain-containing protein n=1 Tax=Crateriforma spongiae TaxID=2724528 RepID=UPI0039AF506D